MNAVEIKGVSYRYPEREEYAIKDLNLTVRSGEFVLIKGSSGSGKSTLCRMLNGLVPNYYGGVISGSVMIEGLDPSKHSVRELSRHVGLVFQDPENQLVMSRVENEIAFGLENQMLDVDEMRRAIMWVSKRLNISHLLDRETDKLSGGEKQKVVLASVLSMKPRILVLDEPTSQLDIESRTVLFDLLKSLNNEGMTVLLVEHNTREVASYVNWVFDLESGTKTPLPGDSPIPPRIHSPSGGEVVLEVRGLAGGYGGSLIIDNIDLTVCKGECLAITGPNGVGKTTLIKHFNGLLKPVKGSVSVCGMDTRTTPTEVLATNVAYLPQNPSDMLFCETVRGELEFTLAHLGLKGNVEGMLERFKLIEYMDEYPRDLSVGEKQRLAIAAVLVANPTVVVLDEPTRGIDSTVRKTLISTIEEMVLEKKAVVVVTQDRDLVNEVASDEINLGERK